MGERIMPDAPLRVLIVEDNPSDAKLLERELQRGGLVFDSTRIETQQQFVAELENEPDVVLCDWNLPQFNGLSALGLLKERWPNTPFILVSGSIGEEAAVNIMKLGANDYLFKDRLARLVPAVEHALAKRAAQLSALRVAAALELSERQLREAQRVARLGSWTWDPPTNHVWWSDGLYEVFGVDRESVAASFEAFLDRVYPDDRPIVLQRVEAVLAGADGFANDLRIVTPNGQLRWIHSRARARRDATGQLIRVEGTDQDITDRKKSEQSLREREEQLQQSQKLEAIGQLAGGVAHDFNNLLTVIGGATELVLASLPPGHPNRELLEVVCEASERGAGLTRQLLAFSRQQFVKPELFDLTPVVRDSCKMLARLIGEDVRLVTDFAGQAVPIEADRGQIDQVLMNLIVNARDAMPRGGRLTVRTSAIDVGEGHPGCPVSYPAGCYVRLSVSDTGEGMPSEVLARIFEPFFTTKPKGKGTGLGLATVHGIVGQARGFINVKSEVGSGTTFDVYFPQQQQKCNVGLSHDRPDLPAHGTELVMLVEDEPAVRKLAVTALRLNGFQIVEAGSGPDAITAYEKCPVPPKLLVTDVVMPDMSGPELVEVLTRRQPGLKVLFVSGYSSDAVLRHGVEQDRVEFLQKPYSLDHLVRAVREVLDKP